MREINTFDETIIDVKTAADHVSKISGRKRNKSVILRWANRGVSGVKLATIRIGGEIFTSQEALNEFLNQSRQASTKRHAQRTREGIKNASIQLDREAEALGI